mgnify:CR=1 FL=1
MTGKNIAIILAVLLTIIGLGVWTFTGLPLGSSSVTALVSDLNLGLDIKGGVTVVYEVKSDLKGDELRELVNQTRTMLSERVNELGLSEPNIYIEGERRITVELPGVQNAQDALEVIGTTALLEFAQVKDGQFAVPDETFDPNKMTVVFSGERIKDAKAVADEYNQPSVSLSLDGEGAKIFAKVTAESMNFINGGTGSPNGQIAIMLDKKIISAPSVGVVISDGSALITGSFTAEEATELAMLIRGGALPAEIEEVETSAIGPRLGQDALDTSLFASLIGFALVVIFMIGYYRLPGLVASVSLVLYITLIMMLMVGLNATLTLPGIAGIVLTVGMAVDANVIIFERIKEELKEGKTYRAAVAHGYSKAMMTIVDSNITTLIAGVILFNFGQGPIKGFAVTLMIGILVSMFTAIVVTRQILNQFSHSKFLTQSKFYGA